ncbi:hypothetical protein SeMB42_g04780 [Synchytrium endobioticum]|uniref:RING-type E3 ubiquitin transferase n=1 Tax=Synchytrium endobioticum TaxID=286115 RepID=A0A507CSG3_9FUNG|nr:hypothetical protein SeLEV6574_g05750 [Synchytrium endobioticum]TPX43280.1 hypothetical protein SeMB42_g04780 [Synchytrium endobioticum]
MPQESTTYPPLLPPPPFPIIASTAPAGQTAASSVRILILWIIFFVMFAFDNPSNDTRYREDATKHLMDMLHHQRNISYEIGNATFALNHTDFTEVLPIIQEIHDTNRFGTAQKVFYTNITGLFRGSYTPFNLNSHHINSSSQYNETLQSKFKKSFNPLASGELSGTLFSNLTVLEKINLVEGKFKWKTTYFEHSLYWWIRPTSISMSVAGLHWVDSGVVWMVMVPSGTRVKARDIMKMALNERAFNESRSIAVSFSKMRESELEELLLENEPYDTSTDDNNPATQSSASPESTCIWYSFTQLRPVSGLNGQPAMNAYESELLNPSGIFSFPSTHPSERLQAKSFTYSPNCGFALDVDELEGLKLELFHIKSIRYCAMMSVVCSLEIWLMLLQIDYSGKVGSSCGKVSLLSMGMITIMDAYLCLVNLTTGAVISNLFLPFVTVAFLKFLLFSIYEMRYLITVSRAQRSGGDRDSLFGALWSRTYLYLFGSLFLFYQMASRITIFVGPAGFIMFSFWWPQIISNVLKNSRKAYHKYYILGTSIVRIILPLYMFGCPHNAITWEKSHPNGVLILLLYMAVQVCILHVQEIWGPRCFIPDGWLPQSYDYHPVLVGGEDDVESGAPTTGAVTNSNAPATSPSLSNVADWRISGKGHPRLNNNDCPICFLPVNTRSDSNGGPRASPSRHDYMVTPCHHIFHTHCLENWMEVRAINVVVFHHRGSSECIHATSSKPSFPTTLHLPKH